MSGRNPVMWAITAASQSQPALAESEPGTHPWYREMWNGHLHHEAKHTVHSTSYAFMQPQLQAPSVKRISTESAQCKVLNN